MNRYRTTLHRAAACGRNLTRRLTAAAATALLISGLAATTATAASAAASGPGAVMTSNGSVIGFNTIGLNCPPPAPSGPPGDDGIGRVPPGCISLNHPFIPTPIGGQP